MLQVYVQQLKLSTSYRVGCVATLGSAKEEDQSDARTLSAACLAWAYVFRNSRSANLKIPITSKIYVIE